MAQNMAQNNDFLMGLRFFLSLFKVCDIITYNHTRNVMIG